jgi:hypothetical protein
MFFDLVIILKLYLFQLIGGVVVENLVEIDFMISKKPLFSSNIRNSVS